MKLTNSLQHPVRLSLAAICALLLGTAGAVAQSSGGSAGGGSGGSSSAGGAGALSPGGTSSSTDPYNTRSSSGSVSGTTRSDTSGTDATSTAGAPTGRSTTPATSSSTPSTTGSTSGAATGSQSGYSTDRATQSDPTGTTYGTDQTRSTTTTGTTATDSTTMTGRSSERLSWGDRRFVTKAADSGMTELQLAQLAAVQASNPEVRSYADRLIQAHSKVKSELTTLAGQKNVKLDEDEDGKDRTYRRLSNKSGREFDQEFVEHMVEMHEDDVKRFEKAARDAKDSEVRSFASKRVDDLRQHLRQAENLRQAIMPTGRADDYRDGRGSSGSTDAVRGSSTTTPRSDSSTGTPGPRSSSSSSDLDTSSGSSRTTPRGGGR